MGMNLRAIVRVAICFAVAVLALAGTASAQQLATLRVTVTDQSGAVVPAANVTVSNPDRGFVRKLISESQGE